MQRSDGKFVRSSKIKLRVYKKEPANIIVANIILAKNNIINKMTLPVIQRTEITYFN